MTTGTMTLSVPGDQLFLVPKDGIALATITDGSVLLQIAAPGRDTVWYMLPPDLARWLTEALATR